MVHCLFKPRQSEPLLDYSSKTLFLKGQLFEYYEHINKINFLLMGVHETFKCHEEVYYMFKLLSLFFYL